MASSVQKEQQWIRSLIECQECYSTLCSEEPPPRCKQGHAFCQQCRKKIRERTQGHLTCGLCQIPIAGSNAEQHEQMLKALTKIVCRYAEHGCVYQLSWSEQTKHEKLCAYRPFACPFSGCPWYGIHPEDHLSLDHEIPVYRSSFQSRVDWALDLDQTHEDGQTFAILIDCGEEAWFLLTAEQEKAGGELHVQIRNLNFVGRYTGVLRLEGSIDPVEFSWPIPSLRSKKQKAIIPADAVTQSRDASATRNLLQLAVSILPDDSMDQGEGDEDEEMLTEDKVV